VQLEYGCFIIGFIVIGHKYRGTEATVVAAGCALQQVKA
jgi:hypothetical protein